MREIFACVEGVLKKCPWHVPDCHVLETADGTWICCDFPHGLKGNAHDFTGQRLHLSGMLLTKPWYLHDQRLAVQKMEVLPEKP